MFDSRLIDHYNQFSYELYAPAKKPGIAFCFFPGTYDHS